MHGGAPQPLPISRCAIASATDAGIAAGLGAFGPDLLQAVGNAFDPLANEACVAVAQIFGADVDDAAGVDHVVRGVKDAARMKALAVLRLRELVVGAAGNDRHAAAPRSSAHRGWRRARTGSARPLRSRGSRQSRRPCRRSHRPASAPSARSTSAIDSRAPSAAACIATPVATLPAPCSAMCSR